MGTAYHHGYCIPSWVLHTLTSTAYSLYRVQTAVVKVEMSSTLHRVQTAVVKVEMSSTLPTVLVKLNNSQL